MRRARAAPHARRWGGGSRPPARNEEGLGLERFPAAAAAAGFGFLDLDAVAPTRPREVVPRAVQQRQAVLIAHQRETVRFEAVVSRLDVVEHHVVLIAGAASGDRADAQRLAGLTFLLLDA